MEQAQKAGINFLLLARCKLVPKVPARAQVNQNSKTKAQQGLPPPTLKFEGKQKTSLTYSPWDWNGLQIKYVGSTTTAV